MCLTHTCTRLHIHLHLRVCSGIWQCAILRCLSTTKSEKKKQQKDCKKKKNKKRENQSRVLHTEHTPQLAKTMQCNFNGKPNKPKTKTITTTSTIEITSSNNNITKVMDRHTEMWHIKERDTAATTPTRWWRLWFWWHHWCLVVNGYCKMTKTGCI